MRERQKCSATGENIDINRLYMKLPKRKGNNLNSAVNETNRSAIDMSL